MNWIQWTPVGTWYHTMLPVVVGCSLILPILHILHTIGYWPAPASTSQATRHALPDEPQPPYLTTS